MGPLAGVKVLDLTRVLAGPWATQLLADLGADVVKVERAVVGDDTRHWGPPYVESTNGGEREAAFFLSCNRGKRSIELDLATPEDQALARRLADVSDVVVENFKVGDLAKFGLDAKTLRAANPRLIYCSITGFGQSGPYAQRPGYDFVVQAMGGLMSITGAPDDEPGGGPMKVGVALADIMTGLYAGNAIIAALYERRERGIGKEIDLALLDVQVATLANQALSYLTTGESPPRLGNAVPAIVPYETFATADGHIIVAAGNDNQFARLCKLLNREALAKDSRFATNAARVANRKLLIPLLREHLSKKTSAEWLTRLEGAGVPAGPINDLEAVFADEHIRFREMRLNLPHPTIGSAPSVACPIRYDGAPLPARRAPPVLGEHNREVLKEWLGESPREHGSEEAPRQEPPISGWSA